MKPTQPPATDLPEDDAHDPVPSFADLVEIPSDALRPVDVATFRKALGWILATEVAMLRRPGKTTWSRGEILGAAIIEAAGPCCTYERYHDHASRVIILLSLLWGDPRFGEYFDPDAKTWEDVADVKMLSYFVRYPFEPVSFGGGDRAEYRSLSVFREMAIGDLDLLDEGKRCYHLLQEMMDSVEYVVGEPVPEAEPAAAELPAVPTGTPWLDDAIEYLTLLRTADVVARSVDETRRAQQRDLVMASARMAQVHEDSRDVDETLRQVLAASDSPTPPPGFERRPLGYFATIQRIRRTRPALTKKYRRHLREMIRGAATGRQVPDIRRKPSKKPPPRRGSSRLPGRWRHARPINAVGLRQIHLLLRDETSTAVGIEDSVRKAAPGKDRDKDLRHRLEILGVALSDSRSRAWLTAEGEPAMPLFCAVAELDFSAVRKGRRAPRRDPRFPGLADGERRATDRAGEGRLGNSPVA